MNESLLLSKDQNTLAKKGERTLIFKNLKICLNVHLRENPLVEILSAEYLKILGVWPTNHNSG